MAILDADNYIRCRQCKSAEFKVETRGNVKENDGTYFFDSKKALVCCKCSEVYDTIDRFSKKILLER